VEIVAFAVWRRSGQGRDNVTFPLDVGHLLQWLGVISVVTFLASLVVIPWLILRLQADYFIQHRYEQKQQQSRHHPLMRILVLVLRNGIGLLLLAAGVAMLVLPGQGIITLLIGLSIMIFPGKHRLLDKFVENIRVQKSLNWIRRKGHKVPFRFTMKQSDDLKA
jgi:hypothetical protein